MVIKHRSQEKQALSSEFTRRGIAHGDALAQTVEESLAQIFRNDPPVTVDTLREIHAAKLREEASAG